MRELGAHSIRHFLRRTSQVFLRGSVQQDVLVHNCDHIDKSGARIDDLNLQSKKGLASVSVCGRTSGVHMSSPNAASVPPRRTGHRGSAAQATAARVPGYMPERVQRPGKPPAQSRTCSRHRVGGPYSASAKRCHPQLSERARRGGVVVSVDSSLRFKGPSNALPAHPRRDPGRASRR